MNTFRKLASAALAIAACICTSLSASAQESQTATQHIGVTLSGPPAAEMFIQKNVMVPMRDGTRLATDVYRPAGAEKYPVVLARTPYGSETAVYVNRAAYFVRHGYAFAVQDVRGRYDSEGEWYGRRDEAEDGSDTITWLGTQLWSNGKVGMTGASYGGIVQYLVMDRQNPYLKALAPQVAALTLGRDASDYDHLAVYGGRDDHPFNFFWMVGNDGRTIQSDSNSAAYATAWNHLPRADLPKIFGRKMEWLPFVMTHRNGFSEELFMRAAHGEWAKPLDDAQWWTKSSYVARYSKVTVPILHISGWYDCCGEPMFKNFQFIRDFAQPSARDNQQLLIGPWQHAWGRGKDQGFDFGPDATVDQDETVRTWFDRWLKDPPAIEQKRPAVRVFVMGANRWREASDWPIPGTRFSKFYLHSNGSALLTSGGGQLSTSVPGREQPDRYSYDPGDPTPIPTAVMTGPADMLPTENRSDVLVYTSEILKTPVEVTGPLTAVLYVSTSAPSTDFIVRLVDVHPDGRAFSLTGAHPAFRTHWSKHVEQLADGSRVVKCEIQLYPTANLFKAGHRIRVEISSSFVIDGSAFGQPKYGVRGLNVEPGSELTATRWNVAQQTVYHDKAHPSHIVLPLISP
jgi:uncharacterized protein